MRSILAIAALVVVAYGQNQQFPTLLSIEDNVISLTDTNPKDDALSNSELEHLLTLWDPSGDHVITRSEFTTYWHSTYGGTTNDVNAFFDNLDVIFPKGQLDALDLIIHRVTLDNAPADGIVSVNEFRSFIDRMHPLGH